MVSLPHLLLPSEKSRIHEGPGYASSMSGKSGSCCYLPLSSLLADLHAASAAHMDILYTVIRLRHTQVLRIAEKSVVAALL